MEIDLRELMIYQSPKELGALWTEVQQTSQILNARQSVALKKQIEINHKHEIEHAKFVKKVKTAIWWFGIFVSIIVFTFIIMWFVVQDRIDKYPQLGTEWFPKTEKQRRLEAQPKHYVGR
jgi:hypothetical protein